ncbi:MAG: hypothetical protein KAI28_05215, partial [Sphingomonadales bacterium]|nr:hypothetical protein [Sphingomonadales bacterium]
MSHGSVPRYWLTIWIDCFHASYAPSTKSQLYSEIGEFYDYALESHFKNVDELLNSCDGKTLEELLHGYLNRLNSAQSGTSIRKWKSTISFLTFVIE